MTNVRRPVVRSFKARFAGEAAAWVKAGGHAIFWENERRARVLFTVPDAKDPHDLGLWSVLDLGKQRWKVESGGVFAGLASTLVPRGCEFVVRRRVERDSVWPRATRTLSLDCLECGACCRDNFVVLTDVDLRRFAKGGRPELGKLPYARRKDGRLVLTLLEGKDCRHLGRDNKCAIYPVRPDACSEFPVASECCLFAREEELGLYDGAPPEH